MMSYDERLSHLGKRVRTLRVLRRLKQGELARRAGVGISTVQRFESTGQATLGNALRIATALGVEEAFDALFVAPRYRTLDEVIERPDLLARRRVRGPREAKPHRKVSRPAPKKKLTRSRVQLQLLEKGSSFVARSEAKRLLEGLDRFKEVVLDFRGVDGVGQGFADEVFRVWARAHPGTKLLPLRMVGAVQSLVNRARAAS
jgi:transcriptional regulator with XRE-family HTH domain